MSSIYHYVLFRCALLVAMATCSIARSAEVDSKPDADRPAAESRKFRFVYGAVVHDLQPGVAARVWLPVAADSPWQNVRRTSVTVPGEPQETIEGRYGNRLIYFSAKADPHGEIPIEVVYEVERSETQIAEVVAQEQEMLKHFLAPAKRIPVDGSFLRQVVSQPVSGDDAMAAARTLYDAVDEHMKYDKPEGEPWGQGDATWACQSGFGNCTDFHSLFIGLCREVKIPAKFEIGFPIPQGSPEGEVGGYHCWAMFAANGHWVAVDISEADKHPDMKEYYFGRLTPDRLTFSVGRDLQLEPRQAAGPVNFLIYPYVEVDGKPHTTFERRFRYADLD